MNDLENTGLSVRSQSQETPCCMMLFVQSIQNRQFHRESSLAVARPGAGFWCSGRAGGIREVGSDC